MENKTKYIDTGSQSTECVNNYVPQSTSSRSCTNTVISMEADDSKDENDHVFIRSMCQEWARVKKRRHRTPR